MHGQFKFSRNFGLPNGQSWTLWFPNNSVLGACNHYFHLLPHSGSLNSSESWQLPRYGQEFIRTKNEGHNCRNYNNMPYRSANFQHCVLKTSILKANSIFIKLPSSNFNFYTILGSLLGWDSFAPILMHETNERCQLHLKLLFTPTYRLSYSSFGVFLFKTRASSWNYLFLIWS